MSGELLINVTPSETRVALIENGVLQEVHVEREAKRGLVVTFTSVKLFAYFLVCKRRLLILI